jgi:altronate dehydratase
MHRISLGLLAGGLLVVGVGCSDNQKSTIKQETKITTPNGTTTITTEKDVKTTGKEPPAAP